MALSVPTFDALYQAARAEVQSRRPDLTDWNEGSVLDALAGAGAILADQVVRYGIDLFSAQFLDTASGEQLDALALDRFGLTRKPAVAALGTLTFGRGAAVGVIAIPAGTTCSGKVSGTTVTVTTVVAAQMLAAEDTVDVTAAVTVTGPTGNLAAGVIDTIVDDLDDDPDATVSNADRFVGGMEAEPDESFRDRIRRYFQTLRRGTGEALQEAALSVGGVQYATVDEAFVHPDDGGYVAVYVGDPDGRGNDALAEAVEAEMDAWRAAGVEVRVLPAAREEIALALTVTVAHGADQGSLLEAIGAGVTAYTDGLAPNETLYLSRVVAEAFAAGDADVKDVEVTTPAADAAPSEPQNALRVPSESLSVSFVEL